MPYYRITIYYDDGSSVKCIRQHQAWDIEFVNRYFVEQMKNHSKGKVVNDIEVVMVTKQSKDVRNYINAQVRKGHSG